MAEPRLRKTSWHKARIWARRLRIGVLLLVLLAVCGLIYLNVVGLPGFLKRPLLAELNRRGVQLQYSRIRLSWYRGIVADNVRLGNTDRPTQPHVSADQARLGLNLTALLARRVEIESFGLINGNLVLPAGGTNGHPRDIVLNRIFSELEFLPDDEWVLQRFSADFRGGKLSIFGRVSNASAIAEWPFLKSREPAAPGSLARHLAKLAETLDQIEFLEQPELKLEIEGDARNFESFSARLTATAPATETTWGTLRDGNLIARLYASRSNAPTHSSLVLRAREALTPWANTTNFHLAARFTAAPGSTNLETATFRVTAAKASTRWASSTALYLDANLQAVAGQPDLVDGSLRLRAETAQTKWAEGSGVHAHARWRHSLTNPVPLSGEVQLKLDDARSGWGSATNLLLLARLAEAPSYPPPGNASWGWWTNIAPYQFAWSARIDQAAIRDIRAQQLASAGTWAAPQLLVTNFQATIENKLFHASGQLDVASRDSTLRVDSAIDPQRIAAVMPPVANEWLSQFTWNQAPAVAGTLSIRLPPWSDPKPDWENAVRPTLRIEAAFDVEGGGTWRKVPVSTARSTIIYSNETWYLPNLVVTRPEGNLYVEHRANERTHAFVWKFDSHFDPQIARPVLSTNAHEGFDLIAFSQAPHIQVELGGVSRQPEAFWARGQLALTNFTFRGQSFSGVQTSFDYTNKHLRFLAPKAQRDTQNLRADLVVVDLERDQVYITNGFSTAEPLPVARAIGVKVGQAIEPYQFALPPVVRVWGTVPLHGEEGADLRFTVDGGPFHWHRFNVPRIQAEVHWAGLELALTNVNVDFYGGKGNGSAHFFFGRGQGTDYQFVFHATNSILQDLMADYFSRTNSLEGRLSGTVTVNHANTEDWHQVQGSGALDLRDGLIWDIPLFGVLSPVLNSVTPGLGSSRASSATCSFVIRNGVIRSDDLEARSPAMRLKYRGTVDLEGVVDARVEAELLRDVWVLGPLVSTVFWPVTKMFEYRATGTLGDPTLEPVYIFPKLMSIPFTPLRIFKGLFPGDSANERSPFKGNESK